MPALFQGKTHTAFDPGREDQQQKYCNTKKSFSIWQRHEKDI
jgi:hypothetical protein